METNYELEERLLLNDAYIKPACAMPFLYGEGNNGKSLLMEHIALITSNKAPEFASDSEKKERRIARAEA